MLKYLLLCLLATSQSINGRPAHSVPGDLGSHILIVTPQAQVHLEPALKYDAPATFLQHLSPFARLSAPHDETIIYVPSGGALDTSSVSVARSAAPKQEGKQYEQISQQIEQAQAAIQQGTSAIGPQLSEAANAAASAASNAGSGLFPSLFPPAAAGSAQKVEKSDFEALPAGPLLSSNVEARRYYALTPAVSHVIDFVHAPVFVGPVSAIRARSVPAVEAESRDGDTPRNPQPIAENLKTEFSLNEVKKDEEKKNTELPFETLQIETDRIKDDREFGREEREGERLIEQRIEKSEGVAKFEENKFEEKKLNEKKFEESNLEEKKFEEKKFEDKKFGDKILEEKFAEEKLQPALEKFSLEREQTALPNVPQPQPQAQIQERKELAAEKQTPQAKDIETQLKELTAEKTVLAESQQPLVQQIIEPELKLQKEQIQQSAQQQKRCKENFLEKSKEQEFKEKREEFKEEKKLEESQPLLKENYNKLENVKSAEPEINKITSETVEKELQSRPQQTAQRAASGRIEGSDTVAIHEEHVKHEEVQQQQKSVIGVPIDQPVVPVFVPQTKAV